LESNAGDAGTGFCWSAEIWRNGSKPSFVEDLMTGPPPTQKPRILVLFSDTGGGHRSAAQAVIESLEDKHSGEFELDMVDVFRAYAPYPLNRAPELYPAMVKLPNLWGLGYRMVDGRRRAVFMMDTLWPWIRPAAKQLVREHPMDLGFCVHPLFSAPVIRVLGKHRPPFITAVTDLVTAPNYWFYRRVDVCVVPTEQVRWRALHNGLRPEQVKLLGLPISKKFAIPQHKNSMRTKLGWPQDRPIVLMVGGGEGMGPIYDTARQISYTSPECALVVIAGRNEKLKLRMEQADWPIPFFVYGFVTNMPDFMKAADILVTKAGPGTISEALACGLPMVLYSRIPGQEDGNVRYVVEEGVGRWAPGTERTARAVRRWIVNPKLRDSAAAACRRIARPNAADDIADLIWDWLPQPVSGSLKS
jgi:1,2-diacylglycerol 3-beta-galactosyltransferase